ncbi:MAG: hypothetical protein FWG66_12480 [Spirochaetes bacterium]|nr:hypothetical protein [Spirochaetota bacterium]
MRKMFWCVMCITLVLFSACGNGEDAQEAAAQPAADYEHTADTGQSPSRSPSQGLDAPAGDFGKQAAIDFLSGFASIFQSSIGLRDSATGGLYAFSNEDGVWIALEDVPPAERPQVFQNGTSPAGYARAGWFTDTWNAFFEAGFFDQYGNQIIDAPFIRESAAENSGVLARGFTLFDLRQNGIPDIVIEFNTIGTRTWHDAGGELFGWGYSTTWFLLFSFIDGEYREVGIAPWRAWGSAGHAGLAPIYYTSQGEIIFYFDDGHSGFVSAYFVRLADSGAYLELIGEDNDAWLWMEANRAGLSQFQPLAALQDEITALIKNR